MSEFVIDDWKLKARTVVKLYRKNTKTLVSLLVKGDIVIWGGFKMHTSIVELFS